MTKHIHGGDVYKYNHCLDFSANCNPLGTPQSVKQAIIDSVDDLSDYPRVGCDPLKEAIAAYEHTQKEYLICGNGAADLIFPFAEHRTRKKHFYWRRPLQSMNRHWSVWNVGLPDIIWKNRRTSA